MTKQTTDNLNLVISDDNGADNVLPDFQGNFNKINNGDKARQADIATEVARATAVESSIATSVTNESTSRANGDAAEITRATTAENALGLKFIQPINPSDLLVAALDGSLFRNPYASASLPIRGPLSLNGPIRTRDLHWSDDIYGANAIPASGKTFYHATGYHPRIFISRSFLRNREIASVSWYINDANLAAGLLTPSGSALSTQTNAPFSAGGIDQTNQILPIDLSGVVTPNANNIFYALVTYKGAYKESASFTWFAKTTLASPTSLLASTPGSTVAVGPNAFLFTGDSTVRGSQLVLDANAGEVLWIGKNDYFGTDGVTNSTTTLTSASAAFTSADVGKLITAIGIPPNTTVTYVNATTVTLSNSATASASGLAFRLARTATVALSGSGITFRGSNTYVGSFDTRGDDYRFEDSGRYSRLTFTQPQDCISGGLPIMAIDGVAFNGTTGQKSHRTVIWDAHIRCAQSDIFFIARAEDVHLRGITAGRGWDLYNSPVHFDGLQAAGWISKSGNLPDAEGTPVGLLVENCDFQANCIIKPDLGPMDEVTLDNTVFHDSWRTGVQLWNHPTSAGDSNTVAQVKFINSRSWGHTATNYNNDVSGGKTPVPVVDRSGSMINSANPAASSIDPPPPDYGMGRPILVGDARSNLGTGTAWSSNFPGVRGINNLAVVIVRANDPTVTCSTPTGFTAGPDSGVGDGVSPRLRVFYQVYNGTVPTVVGTFSASTTWRVITFIAQGVNTANPFEANAFVNSGAGVSQVTTPAARARRRGRQFIHIASIAGTASQGDWAIPINMATQMASANIGQVNNSAGGSTRFTDTTACDIIGYWPWSQDIPSGTQQITFTNTQVGNGSGMTLVLAPQEEPLPRELTLRDVWARDIPSLVQGLTSTEVEGQIAELYKLATTVSGATISPSIVTAKGQIIGSTASGTPAPVPAATADDLGLTSDLTQSTGLTYRRRKGGLVVVSAEQQLGDGISGTITETALIAYSTIAANSVLLGDMYRITLAGNVSNSAGNTFTLRLRIGTTTGGTSLISQAITNASAKTTQQFDISMDVVFRSIASLNAVPAIAKSKLQSSTNTTTTPVLQIGTATNCDMTANRDITLTGKWTTADATSIALVELGSIELIKSGS